MNNNPYAKELSLLQNLLSPLDSKGVSREAAAYFSSFDLNKLEDLEEIFTLFIQGPFLASGELRQDDVLSDLTLLLKADRQIMDDFFGHDFAFAPKAPQDSYLFLQHVWATLTGYRLVRRNPAVSYGLDQDLYPYPAAFYKLIELNLVNFDPWYLLDRELAFSLYKGLQNRYPSRNLVPFARRSDCDDFACFEIGKVSKVQLIHDFASPGWEQRREFEDFWDWVSHAIEDMIDYNRDDGIE